jgi:hypothetical protein
LLHVTCPDSPSSTIPQALRTSESVEWVLVLFGRVYRSDDDVSIDSDLVSRLNSLHTTMPVLLFDPAAAVRCSIECRVVEHQEALPRRSITVSVLEAPIHNAPLITHIISTLVDILVVHRHRCQSLPARHSSVSRTHPTRSHQHLPQSQLRSWRACSPADEQTLLDVRG